MKVEILQYVDSIISESEIQGKSILEAGARNVNGSVRSVIEKHCPSSYLGIDLEEGDGVDEIHDICNLVSVFGQDRFDVVACMETLEHIEDWRLAISNLKTVLKLGGFMVLSAPIPGRKYHGYPLDFWRYSEADWRMIFTDMTIECIQQFNKGIVLKIYKPLDFQEAGLMDIKLQSVKK